MGGVYDRVLGVNECIITSKSSCIPSASTSRPEFGNMLLEQFGGANRRTRGGHEYRSRASTVTIGAQDMLMDIGTGRTQPSRDRRNAGAHCI